MALGSGIANNTGMLLLYRADTEQVDVKELVDSAHCLGTAQMAVSSLSFDPGFASVEVIVSSLWQYHRSQGCVLGCTFRGMRCTYVSQRALCSFGPTPLAFTYVGGRAASQPGVLLLHRPRGGERDARLRALPRRHVGVPPSGRGCAHVTYLSGVFQVCSSQDSGLAGAVGPMGVLLRGCLVGLAVLVGPVSFAPHVFAPKGRGFKSQWSRLGEMLVHPRPCVLSTAGRRREDSRAVQQQRQRRHGTWRRARCGRLCVRFGTHDCLLQFDSWILFSVD